MNDRITCSRTSDHSQTTHMLALSDVHRASTLVPTDLIRLIAAITVRPATSAVLLVQKLIQPENCLLAAKLEHFSVCWRARLD